MKLFHLFYFLLLIFPNKINCEEIIKKSPIIELPQGRLKGFEETSTDGKTFISFLGIPYAKPPVGDLSFEDPEEPVEWIGLLEANTAPETCLQVDMVDVMIANFKLTGKEDCLYLNVFTPKPLKSNASLPVMVYIHGGGFSGGKASLYQPYVLLNEDIVLVVIQYRLEIFGFLSTEDSTMPGNIGMKDQRMALQWVKKNIGTFGGNPDKVTIFGESAGGASSHLHMLSPGSKGLFTGVIAQSGTALCSWAYGDQHRKYAKIFGEKVGCNLKEGSSAFKKCLKKADRNKLLFEMYSLYKWGLVPVVNVPRVDGDFLPADPATLLETGNYNKVNLMTGVTKDEGAFIVLFMQVNPRLEEKLMENFNTYAPLALMVENEPDAANLTKNIFDFYLKKKKIQELPFDEIIEMFSDTIARINYDLTTFLHSQHKDINLFLYEFEYRGQRSIIDHFPNNIPPKYIAHADELFYIFSGGDFFSLPMEREEDVAMRRKVTKLWTNFAKFGNPTPTGSFDFTWKPATATDFQHLSITPSPTMRGYLRKKALTFWRSLNTNKKEIFRIADQVVLEKKDEL